MDIVALFTRAWIEITAPFVVVVAIPVALFTRAWIEITDIIQEITWGERRPLHEGVDWNHLQKMTFRA